MRNDIVDKAIVLAVTQNCTGNCMVTAELLAGTMMGSRSFYDKEGNLVVDDPNYRETKVNCQCGRIFRVKSRADEVSDVQLIRQPVVGG